MNIKNLLLVPALLLSFGVSAQLKKIDFVEYDLDNGLHVILHEDHSTPIVAVTALYHVGSKNENPERTGFAHFFEHLLFEGSQNIKRGEFDTYIENAGGTLNANTSQDRTFYHEILPSNQLELGLWLESERMLHANIETKGIETQREVVKEEKRQRVDNQPYGSLLEQTFAHGFKEHPYKWVPIGSMAHLNAATDEEFYEFYKTFYVPNNAVLSIAGDIDIATTKELIKKYFGSMPGGKVLSVYRDLVTLSVTEVMQRYMKDKTTEEKDEFANDLKTLHPYDVINKWFKDIKKDTEFPEIPRPTVVEPPLGGEVRDTVYDNIQLPAVIMAYRIPAQGTPDFYAVEMLSQLLSQGESSRLTKSVVNDQQKALFVGAFPMPLEDPGLTLAFGITNMGVEPKELEDAIEKEYDKVKNELISEKEFQKLKNQIENDFVSSNSSDAGIAESLANYYTYFGDANLINTEIERYMKVTREDIKRVANKYFVKDNRVVLYYLPKPEEN